jgi:hypothetical protein
MAPAGSASGLRLPAPARVPVSGGRGGKLTATCVQSSGRACTTHPTTEVAAIEEVGNSMVAGACFALIQ